MSRWHEGRLGIFDTETTGIDVENDRIVSFCVGQVGGGLESSVFEVIVDPGVPIPIEASEIHGITDAKAEADGVDPKHGIAEACGAIMKTWSQGLPVIACNASFDFSILDRESRRHLHKPFPIKGPVIDPFVIDRHVDKYRRGKRTLTALCEHYGVRLDSAHDATEDALAAARVAWAVARDHSEIAQMSLNELHRAQKDWHRERQEDFIEYLRREGKAFDDVCTEWPQRKSKEDD